MTSELRRWCETRRREGLARFNAETSAALRRTLRLVRQHLGMDVAFLTHTSRPSVPATSTSIQVTEGDGERFRVRPGPAPPAVGRFVERFLHGELPGVMDDVARREPELAASLGVGSYAAVYVVGAGARFYGLLIALSADPNPTLRYRDVETMRLFAEMGAEIIAAYETRHAVTEQFLRNAEAMLEAGGIQVALQPILELGTRRTMGQEALARFPAGAYSTQDWFIEAWRAGAGIELELDAMSAALALLPTIPASQRLSVNASPDLMISPRLGALLADQPVHRLIIEITEHNLAESIEALTDRVVEWQKRGAWVAIDDAGTGYSSLSQILHLAPDIIKLDRALVTDVDTDPMKRALASAIVTFTSQAKVGLIAEGVESEGELRTLEDLGVPYAQGYRLAPPSFTWHRPDADDSA